MKYVDSNIMTSLNYTLYKVDNAISNIILH